MKRRSLLAAALAICLFPAAVRAEDKAVALFDGKSLDGWDFFLADPLAKMTDVWSVQDGILVCKGEPMGYLATKADYENFRLVVEWRWAPGKEPGNSGVFLRITGEPRALPKCIECQLKSGDAGAIYGFQGFPVKGPAERFTEKKGHELGGDLSGVSKIRGAEKAPGEWNRYEITLKGDKLTVAVNGQTVNEATGLTVVPGHVGLQSEGGEIHFRNVTLTPIQQ